LALKYQLTSTYTSFIAVHQNDNPSNAPLETRPVTISSYTKKPPTLQPTAFNTNLGFSASGAYAPPALFGSYASPTSVSSIQRPTASSTVAPTSRPGRTWGSSGFGSSDSFDVFGSVGSSTSSNSYSGSAFSFGGTGNTTPTYSQPPGNAINFNQPPQPQSKQQFQPQQQFQAQQQPTSINKVSSQDLLSLGTFEVTAPSNNTPSNKLNIIVMQQDADGAWNLTKELADVIGVTLQQLQQSLPAQLQLPQKLKLWATMLAIAFLRLQFKNSKEQWEMIEEKSKSYIESLCGSASAESQIEHAKSVLTQLGIKKN